MTERRFINESFGYGLFTTRSFELNEILFEETPLIYYPDPWEQDGDEQKQDSTSPDASPPKCSYCYTVLSSFPISIELQPHRKRKRDQIELHEDTTLCPSTRALPSSI